MDIKKIIQNNIIAITLGVVPLLLSVSTAYLAYSMAPLVKELALMNNKVEAYEVRIEKLEEGSTSQSEWKMIVDRLDKLDLRLGKLEEKIDKVIWER